MFNLMISLGRRLFISNKMSFTVFSFTNIIRHFCDGCHIMHYKIKLVRWLVCGWAYTHFQNFASFKIFTHRLKNCIHTQKDIKILPDRFLCYIENCCVLQKVFYEIENWVKGRELVCGFADLVVWVSGFRNCVTSKDFVCEQLKETVIRNVSSGPNQHISMISEVLCNTSDCRVMMLNIQLCIMEFL